MRIAIDISQVIYGTGVSTYTRELVSNLVKIDKLNDYTLFGGSLRRKGELTAFVQAYSNDNVNGMVLPTPPALANILWNKMHVYTIDAVLGKLDVFHSSDWTQPSSSAFKVTTVHDLAHIKFPDLTPKKIRKVHETRLDIVKREVDRIIVPSKQTKGDLIEMGFDKDKIRVIYEASSTEINKLGSKQIEKVKQKYGISGKFLLSVGVNPRKNTERIIEAHKSIGKREYSLVLVGHPNGMKLKPSESVKVLGHVSDDELSSLYSGAEVLVYPSLYEGFGIPILDAMKCETPVVTSDIGSMKEVAGKAAVLVDPERTDSVARGIEKAIKNKKSLIEKGKKRVKKFSWQKMAEETLEIYKEADNG